MAHAYVFDRSPQVKCATRLQRQGILSGEDWEEAVAEYGYTYLVLPPHRLFADLASDLVTVQQVMARNKDTQMFAGWSRVIGGLAALMAKTLCNLQQPRQARTWWMTAQHAADASSDDDLSFWISGERLIHRLYEGQPAALLLRKADRIAEVTPGGPSRGLAHLLTARAQLLAIEGPPEAARIELQRSGDVFEMLPTSVTGDVRTIAGWGEDRLRYTEAWVYAHLGDLTRLDQAVADSHAVLPMNDHRTRAQVSLIQVFGHVRAGEVVAGVRRAQAIYGGHPEDQRTAMVNSLAVRVLDAVPAERAALPGIADYREMLSAGPSHKAIT